MTSLRLLPLAAIASIAALAAGCASPPDHFHTLRPVAQAAPSAARAVTRQLAIGPVTVPDALGRDEWVVRNGETGVRVYDHQLWTQGLGADVAQALVDYLNRAALPDALWADAGPTGSGSGADLSVAPVLRVRVQVLRLDSVLAPAPAISDQGPLDDRVPAVRPDAGPVDAGRYRVLRTAVREVAGPAPAADASVADEQQRYDRLARGHSQAVKTVADDIAAALRESADERAHVCVRDAR